MTNAANRVTLYKYDLTQGMAVQLSEQLLGYRVEGIWHTSIMVHGQEFFFDADGIVSGIPVILLTLDFNFIQFFWVR